MIALRTARRQGLPRPRAGAVAFVQRFDYFHVLWLDGVHASGPGRGRVEFCEHGEVKGTLCADVDGFLPHAAVWV